VVHPWPKCHRALTGTSTSFTWYTQSISNESFTYCRAADSIWHNALQSLSSEEQQAMGIIGVGSRLSVLDKLLSSVLEKKELCVQKRWRYQKKNGDVIILRDVFERLAKSIHKFKEAVDVAIQADPVHAALPWAGIRILLQASLYNLENRPTGLLTRLIYLDFN
jgi:hypothetical protein